MREIISALVVLGLLYGAGSSPAHAQTTVVPAGSTTLSPAQVRWQATMDAFSKADHEHPPASEGVLFVGSSTIRMWSNIAQDFRDQPIVINRGFGGSTMADCNYFARQLVVQYKPRHVVVYAGDNDLAEGQTPQQVLASFTQFMTTVRSELPMARVTYISIKPSPLRASLLPRVRETNALIASYLSKQQDAGFIDIYTPMLSAEGLPRPELFGPDQLHMNEAGYRLWQGLIQTRLRMPPSTPVILPVSASTSASATPSAHRPAAQAAAAR